MTIVADRAHDLVRRHVEQHRNELLELVDQELDRVLDELVAERLAARNGNGEVPPADDPIEIGSSYPRAGKMVTTPASSTNGATQPTKVCRHCQLEKPASAFSPGRRVCKACRSRQVAQRAREHRPAATGTAESGSEEGPRPAAPPGA